MKVKAESTATACIVLAAGKGTRMKSALPKVMHPVAHLPMLLHVLRAAHEAGAEKLVLVTSPEMERVRQMVDQYSGQQVLHAVQQQQLGTGDAVRAALPALAGFTGTVVVLFGDTPLMTPATIARAAEGCADSAVCVVGMEAPAPSPYGRLVLGAKGELERIVEAKDASAEEKQITLCNSGVMALQAKSLAELLPQLKNSNAAGEYYLTDLVSLARAAGKRCAVAKGGREELMGVNSRVELAEAEQVMQARLRRAAMENGATLLDPASIHLAFDTRLGQDVTVHPHVVFGPGMVVGDGVEIRSFCHLEGTRIDNKAIIGPFARLRPGSVLGESAHVGNFVEIKKSTLGKGAKVNHLSYVGDAEIGDRANIGAGTITCNYDGFHKNRTVVGAGAFIGSNTSLVAPVIVGEGAVIGAGSVITEDVEAHALSISRAPQKQKPGWAKSYRNRKNN